MASNPYAPPGAPVGEGRPQPPSREPPTAVVRACWLLWCTVALSSVDIVVTHLLGFNTTTIVSDVFGVVFGALLTLWFTSKLRRGRNWMRLLLTTLIVLAFMFLSFVGVATWKLYTTAYAMRPVPLIVCLAFLLIQYSLNMASVVLINTRDARVWFRAMREGSSGAA